MKALIKAIFTYHSAVDMYVFSDKLGQRCKYKENKDRYKFYFFFSVYLLVYSSTSKPIKLRPRHVYGTLLLFVALHSISSDS